MAKADLFELRPHHAGIYVPDIESSIAWYQDKLGFTVAKRLTIEVIPARVVFLKRGDYYIELFEATGAKSKPQTRRTPDQNTLGLKHITFAVENVSKVVGILKQRGVEIVRDVGRIEGKEMAFISDNAGNLIELVSFDAP